MKNTNSLKSLINHTTLFPVSKSQFHGIRWRGALKSGGLSRKLLYLALIAQIGMVILRLEAQEASGVCDAVGEAKVQVSSISKLSFKRYVSCTVQDQAEIEKYLEHLVTKQMPPGRLKAEELVYRAIGLIPENFNYEQGLVNLYLSQVGGYYDPEAKLLVMAKWLSLAFQMGILVHELTHALQDQHYDLRAFIDPKIENGDFLLARAALTEGHATAVAQEYFREAGEQLHLEAGGRKNIHPERGNPEALQGFDVALPVSLQMLASFPYTHGLQFVKLLLSKNGYAEVKRSYARPPRSSEEILHPAKYFARMPDFEEFGDGEVLKCAGPGDWAVKYRETIGEYVIAALLLSHLEEQSEAFQAAQGWGGDRLLFVENAGAERVIVWLTRWDSEKDATEFLKAYLKTIRSRSGQAIKKEESVDEGGWARLNDKWRFRYKRAGWEVCLNFEAVSS